VADRIAFKCLKRAFKGMKFCVTDFISTKHGS
jgi:hypothetical protein